MPKEHENIKYLPGEKSLKVPSIIYVDLRRCDLVKIIPKILIQRKNLSANLQDTHCVQYARLMRQKRDAVYKGDQKELGTEIIDFEEKEMITNKEINSYEKQKVCHICKKSFAIIKTRKKSGITVITPENLEELPIANAI